MAPRFFTPEAVPLLSFVGGIISFGLFTAFRFGTTDPTVRLNNLHDPLKFMHPSRPYHHLMHVENRDKVLSDPESLMIVHRNPNK